MNLKSQRGVIDPLTITLIALGLLGATQFVPNWRVTNLFKRDQVAATSKALAQANADLAKAQADAKTAQDALETARKAELAKKDAQIRYAQQMAAGASESLTKASPEPPVKLALALLDRTNHGLAVAIGDLPADKQAEIIKIVSDSLSGVQARLDAANAALAVKDKELTVATVERDALKVQIPKLETQLATKDADVKQATAIAAQKQTALVSAAQKVQAEIKENGSLGALTDKLEWLLVFCGILYVVVHFALPSLAQEFPASRVLTWMNKAAKSISSSHL